MTNKIIFIIFTAHFLLLSATAKNYGPLEVNPKGICEFQYIDMPIVWKYNPQNEIMKPSKEIYGDNEFLLEGKMSNDSIGTINVTEKVIKKTQSSTRVEYQATIVDEKSLHHSKSPWVQLILPTDIYKGRIVIDGEKLDTPFEARKASKLELFTEAGKFTISGDFQISATERMRLKTIKSLYVAMWFSEDGKDKYKLSLDIDFDKTVVPPPLPCEFTVGDTPDYAQMSFPRKVISSSALDFSFLLDAPAGKYGFVKIDGDRFRFENKPRKKIRFYGTNIAQNACAPTREEAVAMAEELAMAGYNSARLHQFETYLWHGSPTDTAELKKSGIDKFDFLVAELIKRGLYLTIDFYSSGKFAPRDYDDINYRGDNMKAVIFTSDKARKVFKRYISNFLNHINPYTGRAYKDEPALVCASVVNEDNGIPAVGFVRRTQLDRDVFLPIYKKWEIENAENIKNRSQAERWQLFMLERYDIVFNDIREHIRSLSPNLHITDQTNAHGNLYSAVASKRYDVIDWHTYNGHPKFFAKRFSMPMQVHAESALKEYCGAFTHALSRNIANKPSTITEWDFVRPNKYAAEGAFIMGAYGALNGIDGMYRFAYTHHHSHILNNFPLGTFNTSSDAVRSLSDKIGAFIFANTRQSKTIFANLIDENVFFDGDNTYLKKNVKDVPRFGLVGQYVSVVCKDFKSAKKKLKKTPALYMSAFKKMSDTSKSPLPDSSEEGAFEKIVMSNDFSTNVEIDIEKQTFLSSTKQLYLDNKVGKWKAITPKYEAFIEPEGEKLEGKFASVDNTTGWAATAICAIDNVPLTKSKRMTVFHLTHLMNKGQKFGNKDMTVCLSNGTNPQFLKLAKTRLKINSNLDGFKCFALDMSGKKLAQIPVSRNENSAEILLSTHNKFGQTIAYELVFE